MGLDELLLEILRELDDAEFEEFKWNLNRRGISKCKLDGAKRWETVDKIIQTHNQQSREVMREILRSMSRNDLVEKLSGSNCTGEKETFGGTDDVKKRSPSEEVSPSPHVVKATSSALIQEEREQAESIKPRQKEIQPTLEALKKAEMKSEESFSVEDDGSDKDKERIKGGRRWWQLWLFYEGAVRCTVCKENCHYPCKRAWFPKYCKVMRDNRCTKCPGRCPVSEHVKGRWRYVTKTKKYNERPQHMDRSEADHNQTKSPKETVQTTDTVLFKAPQSLRHAVTLDPTTVDNVSQSTPVPSGCLTEENGGKCGVREETQNHEETEEARAAAPVTAAGEADPVTLKSTSHKYDYITSKELIHSGSPWVYQLIPKRRNIGTLTKMTLGQRDPNRINKTILLVGETGVGKSTLINVLVNYDMGVKWEDNVWFEIVEETEIRAQSESQTSDVMVYEFFGFEDKTLPYSLTIVDTPGYGDTRGAEGDEVLSQRLFDLFRSDDGVYELNVVGLVLKASDNRLSDRLRYVFDSVVSLFGKDLEENIITLITHSDGTTPHEALNAITTADIKCAKNEKNQPVHFLFSNGQKSERTKNSQTSWKITNTGMSDFTSYLLSLLPRNLRNTTEVLNSRITLTACIQNLRERVELIEIRQREIQQTHEALTKSKEEMESIENFCVEVDVPYKVKEKIGGGMWGVVFYHGAVCCNVCQENCHYPGCTLAWYPKHCEVMSGGHCTSCQGKCPVSDHVKKLEKYVTKTEKVVMTIQDVKQKYEKSKADGVDPQDDNKHLEDFERVRLLLKEKNKESTADGAESESQQEDAERERRGLEEFKKAKTTLEERRATYERNKADREETTRLLVDLEKLMKKLQEDKVLWLQQAFQHVVRLEQIALNTDALSSHARLDFLIKRMKECRDVSENDKFQREIQKLEDMKSRVDEKAGLRYRFGKVKAVRKSHSVRRK